MREVTHEGDGPYVLGPEDVDEEKGDVAICTCGLSGEYPFCDGSHTATRDEEPGVRYKYTDDRPGERRVVEGFEFADGPPETAEAQTRSPSGTGGTAEPTADEDSED